MPLVLHNCIFSETLAQRFTVSPRSADPTPTPTHNLTLNPNPNPHAKSAKGETVKLQKPSGAWNESKFHHFNYSGLTRLRERGRERAGIGRWASSRRLLRSFGQRRQRRCERSIPTGLNHSAQGWSRATTLGHRPKNIFNPDGVASHRCT